MSRRFLPLGLAAAVILATGSLGSAHAATITVRSDAGWLGTFTLTNNGGNFSLNFTNLDVQSLNLINGSVVNIPAAFSNPIDFTATPNTGPRDFLVTSGDETKSFTADDSTASLTFILDHGQAGDENNSDGLILTGSIIDAPSSSLTMGGNTYDFSKMVDGVITFALTGTDYTGGAGSMFDVMTISGTSVTGTAVFSQAAIPEPSSMALLGIGLGGLLAFRRRFAKRPTA